MDPFFFCCLTSDSHQHSCKHAPQTRGQRGAAPRVPHCGHRVGPPLDLRPLPASGHGMRGLLWVSSFHSPSWFIVGTLHSRGPLESSFFLSIFLLSVHPAITHYFYFQRSASRWRKDVQEHAPALRKNTLQRGSTRPVNEPS